LDLLDVLTEDYLLFQTITMLIIDVLHLIVNIEGEVDMMCEYIFTLGDIHILKPSDVGFQFIYRLRSILLFYYGLYLLHLLRESGFKGVEVLVANILEYLIVICKS
jgi:hypothetical protein